MRRCPWPHTLLVLACTLWALSGISYETAADQSIYSLPAGSQTIGLIAGPFFPIRLTPSQSTKLFGAATALSSSFTVTGLLGAGWYQSQLSLGAELIGFSTTEPIGAYGIGLSPKLVYTFTALGRLRPFVEGGGGPLWTDLGGRVPEQGGQFNFLVWGGAGCSWGWDAHWALQAGYRFTHISNAGTRDPNSGLNFGLPFVGVSYSLF
ncbi:MAG TPA: acyloxyacyl hydrolase [Nitrospira sp.]|nr:acyloxyacyl hydrolase [Nitrospira sp.]